MQTTILGTRLLKISILLLFACSLPEANEEMNSSTNECHESSLGEIVGDARIIDAENLPQFREGLDRTGVEYTLRLSDPTLPLPTPRCPHCRASHYDRVLYLILERSRQTRTLQRFRIYLDGDRLVCIEDYFSYKNPYER